MKSLIMWTLRQRRWFTLWWLVGISAFIFLNMVFYPSFRDQAAELEKTLADLPDSAMALMSDTGDFFSPVGYLSSQVFYLMLPLLLGVMAIALGSSLIAREEREGTIELLLSRPVSRATLVAAKGTVGLLLVALAGLVATLITAVMASAVSLDVPASNILQAGAAATLLAMSFGTIAFTVTMMGRTARGASVGIATLVALGGYILSSLSTAVDWLEWPSRLLPHYYYRPAEILTGTYNWANMLFIGAIILGGAGISWIAFRRRDVGA